MLLYYEVYYWNNLLRYDGIRFDENTSLTNLTPRSIGYFDNRALLAII